jgi:transcriptional regulator with XRE-family HTH domain
MVSYTKRIRDLREDLDLKQEHIAKLLGVKQTYYSRYELGKIEIPTRHIITLCKLYDVSADYLLGFTNEKKPLPKK